MALVLELGQDVPRPHHRVLHVGPRLPREGQRLLHVEGDDLGAAELEEEVAQRAGGDLVRGPRALGRRPAVGLARLLAGVDLGPRLGREGVHEVVRLDPEPLPAGDLHRRLVPRDLVAHRARGGGGEDDLLVGEVVAARGRRLVAQGGHARLHHPLGIGLADVDHVVDVPGMAEHGRARLALFARRGPEHVAVLVDALPAIPEVAVEEAQLPELVGDVLARVGDGAVGADDDLVVVAAFRFHGEDPAARVLALRLQADGARGLELLEGAVPEVQAEDVALVREQVVADGEPLHGGQVALHDARRHQRGQARRLVASLLDGVQRLRLQPLSRGIGGVEVAHLRVEVPAVVVEAVRARELRDLVAGLAVHVQEADHHVRHLDARVVDVVLHADLAPALAQHAHEGVAQDGVAQVADVGGLVGVDARVLHHHVPAHAGCSRPPHELGVEVAREGGALEEHVDVAAARHLRPAYAGRGAQRARQPLRDLARRAPQRLAEVEGGGEGEVPELRPWRVLEGDGGEVGVEGGARGRADGFAELGLDLEDHRGTRPCGGHAHRDYRSRARARGASRGGDCE